MKFPASAMRRDHVERPGVLADDRRENSARDSGAVELELRRPVEHGAELRPVDEILAVKDRNAGKVRERRRHEVVVVPCRTMLGSG